MLSLRSDGLLTLAPVPGALRFLVRLSVGAGARFEGQPVRGRRPGRQAVSHLAGGEKKTWPSSTAWRSTPSRRRARTASTRPPRPTAKSTASSRDGKREALLRSQAKYIWALAFDKQGDLFVATGDQGEIHHVTPDGKGSVFFKSDETHARSMALDAAGQSDGRHRSRAAW